MFYSNLGKIKPWEKNSRSIFSRNRLLVIGNGNIGSRVSKLMSSFLKVKTFDIKENELSELKKMMQEADCVTINIPNNSNNISFLNQEKLSWIKDNAILINTARGNVVEENALYAEIKNKRLRAAFDVFWDEPYKGKLKQFYPEGFLMTPHVASTCNEFLEGIRDDLNKLIICLKS